MQIAKDLVATIDYTLKDDDGNVMDTSEGTPGLAYIHGAMNIIPGLEKALEGKSVGDSVSVSIPPEEAYGFRDDEKIQNVPKEMFEGSDEIEIGREYYGVSPDGHPVSFRVLEIQEEEVKIDGNHPMADLTLHFDVNITDIREATTEELSHGHVHGPEGHEH